MPPPGPPKINFLNDLSWGAIFLKSVDICVGRSKGLQLSKLPCSVVSFSLKVQAEKIVSVFPKTFYGVYLFVLDKYLCNRSPKTRKHFKYYILILAIVNYRNWLESLTPLTNHP